MRLLAIKNRIFATGITVLMILPVGMTIFNNLYYFYGISIIYFLCGSICFIRRFNKYNLLFWNLISIGVVFFIIGLIKGRLDAIYFAFLLITYLVLSYEMTAINRDVLVNSSVMVLILYFLFFLFMGMSKGFLPEQINNFFPGLSRNYVSTLAIFFQILYSVSFLNRFNKLPEITPFITLALCVVSYGRTGIIVSALIVCITLAYNLLTTASLIRRVLTIIVILSLTAITLFYAEDISSLTNFSEGLETPRTAMINDYFRALSFSDVIIGPVLTDIPIINEFDGNPHNSFLLGHSIFGALYIFFLGAIIYTMIVNVRYFVYILFSLVLLIRYSTDTVGLPGNFDFIFYYLLFTIASRRNVSFGAKCYLLQPK